jgi:soluble lytic murein transglycosylase-like protein
LTRFCFILITVALFAGAIVAAPPEAAASGVKTVVRADPRTGKLVRVVIAPGAEAPAPAVIGSIVERVAAEQSLPPELIHSVIQVESNYNASAVSPKGAQGLMQLMPDTARRFGVPDSFDPAANIQGGAKYLKYLLDLYNGDYPKALAAYNAGEKAVAKYGGIPPYAETQNYVERVRRKLDASKPRTAAKEPAAQPVETAPAGPRHIQEIVASDGTVRYVTQ